MKTTALIGTSFEPLGYCALVNCPLCMTPRRFHLLRIKDMASSESGILVVRCEGCGRMHDVPDSEKDAAVGAVGLYEELDRRGISYAEYGPRFASLGFETIQRLDREGEHWRCHSCAEKVPGNFVECWNCQSVRPGYEGTSDGPLNAELPALPRTSIVNHPDKPWES